jgi:hypothetical protein
MHSHSRAADEVKIALTYSADLPGSPEWQAAARKALALLISAAAKEKQQPCLDDNKPAMCST